MSVTPVAERLRRSGSRATPQRVVVAEELAAAGRQVSAEALWQRLRRRQPRIGRATVFRALDALVAAGAARRLEMGNHVSGYVACETRHHHHLACGQCGRVVDIPERLVEPLARRISGELGVLVDDARLDFYGRCASCAASDGTDPVRAPGT